jgi:hypothetical protein
MYWSNDDTVTVVVTDFVTKLPIDNATVLVTFYSGRDRKRPDLTPGTPVSSVLTNLNLPHTGSGTYSIKIPASNVPPPGTYVRVTDATTPSPSVGHWEDLVIVPVRKDTDN